MNYKGNNALQVLTRLLKMRMDIQQELMHELIVLDLCWKVKRTRQDSIFIILA